MSNFFRSKSKIRRLKLSEKETNIRWRIIGVKQTRDSCKADGRTLHCTSFYFHSRSQRTSQHIHVSYRVHLLYRVHVSYGHGSSFALKRVSFIFCSTFVFLKASCVKQLIEIPKWDEITVFKCSKFLVWGIQSVLNTSFINLSWTEVDCRDALRERSSVLTSLLHKKDSVPVWWDEAWWETQSLLTPGSPNEFNLYKNIFNENQEFIQRRRDGSWTDDLWEERSQIDRLRYGWVGKRLWNSPGVQSAAVCFNSRVSDLWRRLRVRKGTERLQKPQKC